MSELIIYQNDQSQAQVSVRLDGESVWLTQEQMGFIFERERSVITKHLRNIFRDGEVAEESNVQILHIAGSDKPVKFYNLDVIISVGYRVNSKRGVQFRQWATRVLRDHLVRGYTINQTRLAEKGLADMRRTIELLARTLTDVELVTETGKAVLSVIVEYARTWRILLQYDENDLSLPAGCRPARGVLDSVFTRQAIMTLRKELKDRGEATDLFGAERECGLDAILGNIEQTMFGEPLYRTREEKAAHLLYFIIKDHPFLDGNKRTGSFLFLLYLRQESIPASITENTLTALALLIAQSDPTAKDLMIRLIVNLLVAE